MPIQNKISKIVPQEDDKNCQSTKFIKSVCSYKNCQLQPVKPPMDMWLPKPAIPYKHARLCSDKNCQSKRCYRKKSPVRPMYGNDKNCQEIPNVHVWPKKQAKESSHMLSVTKSKKQCNHKKCDLSKFLCLSICQS